jgi:cytochrome c553
VLILGITTNGKIGLGLVALAFIAFALVSSFVLPRRNPDFPGERVGAFVAVAVLFFAALMLSVFFFARESEEGHGAEGGETATHAESTATTETGGGEAPAGDAAAGEAVFASAGCGGCHTLAAAGSGGTVGPNLDEAKPSLELAIDRVTNGRGGMPSFKGQLSEEQIRAVATFVAENAGG